MCNVMNSRQVYGRRGQPVVLQIVADLIINRSTMKIVFI